MGQNNCCFGSSVNNTTNNGPNNNNGGIKSEEKKIQNATTYENDPPLQNLESHDTTNNNVKKNKESVMTDSGKEENDVNMLPVSQKSGVLQSETIESNKPEQSNIEKNESLNPLAQSYNGFNVNMRWEDLAEENEEDEDEEPANFFTAPSANSKSGMLSVGKTKK